MYLSYGRCDMMLTIKLFIGFNHTFSDVSDQSWINSLSLIFSFLVAYNITLAIHQGSADISVNLILMSSERVRVKHLPKISVLGRIWLTDGMLCLKCFCVVFDVVWFDHFL